MTKIIQPTLWFGFLALATLGCCAPVRAGVILAVDFGATGPVQTGFDPFLGTSGFADANGFGPVSDTYHGGITVTVDASSSHALADRLRGVIPHNGTFNESDLLRDVVSSSDGLNLIVTIAGLTPNANYDLQLWSYDASSFNILTDWFANNVLVQSNYRQNNGVPTSNATYRFGFTATSDALGQIQIIGNPQSAFEGARLNGLQISSTSAAPEPNSALLVGASILGLFGYGWRCRRRKVAGQREARTVEVHKTPKG